MSGVVVTGASGFIGRALVRELLQDGVNVTVVARQTTDLADVTVPSIRSAGQELIDDLEALHPAVILHLATHFVARHRTEDIAPLVESNIEFGTYLLEAAHRARSVFISTGSAWQHEGGSGYHPVSLYAATKQALSDIAAYYRSEGLLVSEITLFDTYGPHDRRRKLVPLLVDAARTGRTLEMSSGEQLIDLTYVDDVVTALRTAMLDPAGADGGVVRGPELVTVRELVHRFERANDLSLDARWGMLPDRGREMREDWRFGHAIPGWVPQVGLDQGLRACMEQA